MSDDLDPLPGAELAVNLPTGFFELLFQGGNFLAGLDFLFTGEFAELLQPLFEFEERLFKLQQGDGFGFGHKGKSYRLPPPRGNRGSHGRKGFRGEAGSDRMPA